MNRMHALLVLLTDGRQHSGEALGHALGISRAAVWKLIARLRELGVAVLAVPGNGYQLQDRFELLDGVAIMDALKPQASKLLQALDTALNVESTNQTLLVDAARAERPRVLLAETQTAGRGRRGRAWYSPFGASLYLSMLWPFSELRSGLSGLSLVVGLAVAEAMETALGLTVQLKWPNDVVHGGRKLAGILLEVAGEPNGPCRVVVGVGINCRLPPDAATAIDQPWTDVASLLNEQSPVALDRNRLAAAVIDALCQRLPLFAREGFQAFHEEWNQHDALAGRQVVMQAGDQSHPGIMVGVSPEGALLLDEGAGPQPWVSGEVSVRTS